MDYEDGKIARVESISEEGVPFNVFIDNAGEFPNLREGPCEIDISGVGSDIEVYAIEEDYEKAHPQFAAISMIPIGTFPPRGEDGPFEESPHVMFAGRVTDAEWNPDADPDEPNCWLKVETYGFDFGLFIRWDRPVEPCSIVSGIAWLFASIAENGDGTSAH